MELIAHRAGNDPSTVAAAAPVADAIELDLHQFRRRLEVRHAKVVWPTPVQWDRWWIELHPANPPRLREVVHAAPTGTRFWLDVKAFSGRVTAAALRELAPASVTAVSSRNWWVLRPARVRGVRTLRSVGSRWQLVAVLLVRRWAPTDGIVLHQRFATPNTLRRLRSRTTTIVTWAVGDTERAAELIRHGVTGLIVDDLDLLEDLRALTAGER